MKRVDWDPHGDRNTQNRGVSKYERISWDEATDIIASEMTRIMKEYSQYAILCQADGHGETKVVHAAHGVNANFMARCFGGFCDQTRNPDSWEGWYWGSKHVWGCNDLGEGDIGNLLLDIAENCDMLLHWGCDLETTPWGWGGFIASRYCFWMTDLGIKQIFISPDLNYSAAVHADKWIPVLPNTDSALQLAIAYVWIEKGWYDKEYMDTHSIGFDWEVYHITGGDDGIPKTPEWAEGICGVPARTIKALAKEWYKQATSIGHCNGGSYIRSTFSSEPARLECLLLAMQGLGKPGRAQIKFIEWGLFGKASQCPMPMSECYPSVQAAFQGFFFPDLNVYDLRKCCLPKTLIPEAILGNYTYENPLTWYGTGLAGWPRSDQFVKYQYPSEVSKTRIHMIWSDSPCWTTCWNGGNRFIEAVRSPEIEFYLVQHPWMQNDCLYADIILPVNTKFEESDIGVDVANGYYSLMFLEQRCIEPLGESKSDWETVCEIAKKLGKFEEFTQGRTEGDWIKLGFETSQINDGMSWEEFKKRGYWVSKIRDDWRDEPRGFRPFADDPEKNPLETPTGKLEFYSSTLAEHFPDDDERRPYARWIATSDNHQERLGTERAEKYPYLLESNHPRWRVHANLDDVPWLREISTCKVVGPDGYQYEPVWVNPLIAEKEGVADGDIVKLFNDHGWVLGGVIVTERIMPGVVYQDHGARIDPIEPGVSDRGGANNLIAPHRVASKNTVAEVTSGYLVGIEKVDVFELAEKWPEPFSRPFTPGYGIDLENWIEQ